MSAAPIDAAAPKPRRGMLGFYIAGLVLVALAGLGAWMWTAWDKWHFDEYEAQRRQSEAARQLGVPVKLSVDLLPSPSGFGAASGDGIKLDLVLVPPGMFDMGSLGTEEGRHPREGPIHRVRISRAFYMGKYEVMQEQWGKVMGTNPSKFKGPKLPVDTVSWDDCQEFLKKLNETIPHPVPLPAAGEGAKRRGGFRLPTEAEWEWACRAGTRTRFCSGDDDARCSDHAWHQENSRKTTHPVGEKRPNAWGLHDCHGNVWEWCASWYVDYSANPWPGKFRWTRDPQGPATGAERTLRGGSWAYGRADCRSATRGDREPAIRDSDYGLRVALSVAGP